MSTNAHLSTELQARIARINAENAEEQRWERQYDDEWWKHFRTGENVHELKARVPPELIQLLRRAATDRDVTVSAIVAEAVHAWLERYERTAVEYRTIAGGKPR